MWILSVAHWHIEYYTIELSGQIDVTLPIKERLKKERKNQQNFILKKIIL